MGCCMTPGQGGHTHEEKHEERAGCCKDGEGKGGCGPSSECCPVMADISLLLMRVVLAYGFYGPAMKKIGDIDGVAGWLASMNFFAPQLMAYAVAGFEAAGVALLALGFLTRLITLPLMVIMAVAIFAVHLPKGFAASGGGFEIPLYYLIMLFALFTRGAGRFSLDKMMCNKMGKGCCN